MKREVFSQSADDTMFNHVPVEHVRTDYLARLRRVIEAG